MARQTNLTLGEEPVWYKRFLEVLSGTGNVRLSCMAANVSRPTVYEHYNKNKDFADRWDDALEDAADILEQEATRRAVRGADKPVIYKGELCGRWVNDKDETVSPGTPNARLVTLAVKEYSDSLLMFMLRGARPEKYRDNYDVGKLANELALARATTPQPATADPKAGRKTRGKK